MGCPLGRLTHCAFIFTLLLQAWNPVPSFSSEGPSDAKVLSVPAVVEAVSPSVVTILTRGIPAHPFQHPTAPGSGSGIIIDTQGHILTNNHVINDAGRVHVTLSDGTELPAKIVGQDPDTDVAVLKVDPDDYDGKLPSLTLGDSESIRVGDWAVAVGNPFGQLAGTLTVPANIDAVSSTTIAPWPACGSAL